MVIVDRHLVVAESLRAVLSQQADLAVVATAGSLAEAAALPPELAPDVAVMDVELDDGNGADVAQALRAIYPRVTLVILSREQGDDAKLAAVEAGAAAFLHKSVTGDEVLDAIRHVADGGTLITPQVFATLISHGRERSEIRHSLSPRELEVLGLIAHGMHMRDIAADLGISYTTVRTHVRAINSKLGATSMLQAVVIARELSLVH